MYIESNMKQRKQIIEGREVFIFQEKTCYEELWRYFCRIKM